MKKIIYSNYTKFIAVILFIASIVLGALVVTDGISKYFDEEELVYHFENDFSESRYFSHLLDEPENVIFNAYHNLFELSASDNADIVPNEENTLYPTDTGLSIVNDENGTTVKTKITPNKETIEKNIEERLNNLYCNDLINYYIKWNDRVFTNCGATSPEELMQGEFYSYLSRNGAKGIDRARSTKTKYYGYLIDGIDRYDTTSTIILSTSIKENVVAEYKVVWERQETIVNNTFTQTLIFVIVALLLLIYLISVCGKNKDGEHKTMWLDNIWAEVHLIAMAVVGIGAVVICAIFLDEYSTGHLPYKLMMMIAGAASALTSIVCITSLLSIIRNIKCKRFVESSIIVRVIRWCFKIFVKVLVWLRNGFVGCRNLVFRTLSKKTGIILISMLFVYTALIGMFGFLGYHEALFIVLGILLFFFGAFVVAYRAKDLDEVKKGVSEVRNGNVAYKIPELKSEDMKALATNINDIAKGLDESVSAKVKAERMKTELITNVSHDLKTPLTSIISYTELLSNVEGLPEEAKDYAQIIANKSDRLKTLTQDLFDISKVQSGNESVVLEKLDVSLLINQSLGEHDNEIKKSELPFCVNAPKELYISADGRKMSRVISNLISNILKYTMKNTRVFISAYEENGEVVMEFKNIASYPMDFNADEIVGRFVRGDESRTQEGNGLGLAIAKSYTEICNGKFEIVLDGDMFKAILKFRKYS